MLILTFFGVLGGMGIRMSSAFREVDKGLAAMALLTAGFAVGRAFISLVTPRMAIGKGSRFVALGFAGLGLVGIGYAFSPFWVYPYLRVLHGAFSGIAWPSMQALVITSAPIERRARTASKYFFFGMIGSSAAYALSGTSPNVTLVVGTSLLFIVSLVLVLLNVKVAETRKKPSSKRFLDVPAVTILLSSLALGTVMSLVDTEITVEIFYRAFGRVVGGLTLGLVSGLGALLGYAFGKHLLDVKQSLTSLIVPGSIALLGALGVTLGGSLAPLGVVTGKAALTWWRSMNLALSKGSKTDLKVGLDNFGRNVGTFCSSFLISACPVCTTLVLGLAAVSFIGALSAAGFTSRLSRWRTHHP